VQKNDSRTTVGQFNRKIKAAGQHITNQPDDRSVESAELSWSILATCDWSSGITWLTTSQLDQWFNVMASVNRNIVKELNYKSAILVIW